MELDWRDDAACKDADTEMFFPDTYIAAELRPALALCRSCPVRRECLADALKSPIVDDHGIRGGLAESARAKLRAPGGRAKRLPDVLPKPDYTCTVGDCNAETMQARRYCYTHYREINRAEKAAKRAAREAAAKAKQEVVKEGCAVTDCDRDLYAKGLCRAHYDRMSRPKQVRASRAKPKRPDRGCTVEGCQGKHRALGLCHTHYSQHSRAKVREQKTEPEPKPEPKLLERCSVEGCRNVETAKRLCMAHYTRLRRGKPLNTPLAPSRRIEGECERHACKNPIHKHGLCRVHIARLASESYA